MLAFLSGCIEAEFSVVRDYCKVSDSVLSKAAAALEAAGHIKVKKGYVGKRPRTWLAATRPGRDVLAAHLAALQQLASNAREAGSASAESG
ncbi:transcriptional regulator [Kitasatospora sp. NPDC054939]